MRLHFESVFMRVCIPLLFLSSFRDINKIDGTIYNNIVEIYDILFLCLPFVPLGENQKKK